MIKTCLLLLIIGINIQKLCDRFLTLTVNKLQYSYKDLMYVGINFGASVNIKIKPSNTTSNFISRTQSSPQQPIELKPEENIAFKCSKQVGLLEIDTLLIISSIRLKIETEYYYPEKKEKIEITTSETRKLSEDSFFFYFGDYSLDNLKNIVFQEYHIPCEILSTSLMVKSVFMKRIDKDGNIINNNAKGDTILEVELIGNPNTQYVDRSCEYDIYRNNSKSTSVSEYSVGKEITVKALV